MCSDLEVNNKTKKLSRKYNAFIITQDCHARKGVGVQRVMKKKRNTLYHFHLADISL